MPEGTIIKALSGFYYVSSPEGLTTCRGRGKHRHQNTSPLVGDHVTFSITPSQEGALDEILPRKNQFKRPSVANIDQLVLIASGAIPKTDPFLIDRITSIAAGKDCDVLIVINKCDLDPGEDLFHIYNHSGFKTLRVSAETGQGMEELRGFLKGKISAFSGNSGVGKSSILNCLEKNMSLATGEISEKLGRGRHTTRHIELFPLEIGGFVADTPGFAAFEEDKLEIQRKEDLAGTFLEFLPFIQECQFKDCAHIKEKGCSLLEAMKQGTVLPSRHESYVRLYEQAKLIPDWQREKESQQSTQK